MTNCHGLKLPAPDGKMREIDCADTEGMFRPDSSTYPASGRRMPDASRADLATDSQSPLAQSIRGRKGNIRDYANIAQLICLSNLENLNALFISEGKDQPERLKKLNDIAIAQMQLLVAHLKVKTIEQKDKN